MNNIHSLNKIGSPTHQKPQDQQVIEAIPPHLKPVAFQPSAYLLPREDLIPKDAEIVVHFYGNPPHTSGTLRSSPPRTRRPIRAHLLPSNPKESYDEENEAKGWHLFELMKKQADKS
ncbi:MAG: hypothetical protein ACSNEK_02320 [Parachlamydiaceae bacterium]